MLHKRLPYGWLLMLIAWFSVSGLAAQEKEYMYEIGATGGASWAYGDVNATKAVYSPASAFGIIYRYNINLRWALAAELQSAGLSGDTRDFDYAFPGGDYSFDQRSWQLSVRPEIHFWNYGWGSDYREKKRYAPYLTLGLSAGMITGGDDNDFVFGVPLGAGMKWKMSPRFNAQLSCLFTRTFSDALDGKADPTGIKTSALTGHDWMATITLGLTFDFGERCIECHNQKNQAR